MAANEEQQKLLQEIESAKRKAENGYERYVSIRTTFFNNLWKNLNCERIMNLQCANKVLHICSSQEPDAKRQRVDDTSGAVSTGTDAQANNSAYNYNWYQVSRIFFFFLHFCLFELM